MTTAGQSSKCYHRNLRKRQSAQEVGLSEIFGKTLFLFYTFQGGVYVEGDVAMTAFVLASLAECKCGGVVCELQLVPTILTMLEWPY